MGRIRGAGLKWEGVTGKDEEITNHFVFELAGG